MKYTFVLKWLDGYTQWKAENLTNSPILFLMTGQYFHRLKIK